jgi:hypothetical protein
MRTVLVRARPYWCTHVALHVPYLMHRAYELELVDHGHTMAPSKRQVRAWALDYLECSNDKEEWEVIIEWD